MLQRQFLGYRITRSLDNELLEGKTQETNLYTNKYKYKSILKYGQSSNQKSENRCLRYLRSWSMTNTLLLELKMVDSIYSHFILILILFSIYFSYLKIRIRVSMMLYDMTLCHISVTCHGHGHTEGCKRFWNNNVIQYV